MERSFWSKSVDPVRPRLPRFTRIRCRAGRSRIGNRSMCICMQLLGGQQISQPCSVVVRPRGAQECCTTSASARRLSKTTCRLATTAPRVRTIRQQVHGKQPLATKAASAACWPSSLRGTMPAWPISVICITILTPPNRSRCSGRAGDDGNARAGPVALRPSQPARDRRRGLRRRHHGPSMPPATARWHSPPRAATQLTSQSTTSCCARAPWYTR